jgi:uncharacterized protein HemY
MQTIPTALTTAGRKLMTASLLASMYQQHDDAEIASAAVEATLPDPTRYRLCRAVAKAMGGDASFATEMLESHSQQHPDDDRAKVTLASAMMLGGNPEWRSVIDRVLALSTDVCARTGATNLLDFLDKRASRRQGRG